MQLRPEEITATGLHQKLGTLCREVADIIDWFVQFKSFGKSVDGSNFQKCLGKIARFCSRQPSREP